ncbi:nudC domain-containing protein 3 [Parasteatoda tepidariorum]|uniref:nudC domain-containing protein 3 n=1 Tax=Parasteatoda tepidariorum TaxID=114398 RepID=UPI00077FB00E|nr:nudC domain-containing protein 3 [Parasteatoda tepidariorum]XP_015916989.1 nudC domain-containing protein 3 [Parasteatoda tepidariorum]
MPTETNYDDLISSILCGEGNIIDFFDKMFDFLYRRTDFFKLKSDSSDLGLASGEAESIVRSVFCKYMEQSILEKNIEATSSSEPVISECIAEEIVVTSPEQVESEPKTDDNIKTNELVNVSKSLHNDDKSDHKTPLMDPDSYNGASYEGYSWAQTIKDADVRIKVPNHVTTGKKIRVLIQHTHLKAEYLNNDEWVILKDNDLSWRINVEESTWTLVPREHIHICVQKVQERWWDSFFVDEPKIDLKSIDPSIPFEELDEAAQAKINELMFNQHQKRLGKPTIEQSKLQNVLKEAWDCEGSPFKGQPFDPTVVDIQNSENALIGH